MCIEGSGFFRAQAQAELGAPPQQVFRRARPFVFGEIAQFRLVEIGPEMASEIGERGGLAQKRAGTRAVKAEQAAGMGGREKRIGRLQLLQFLLEGDILKIAAGQGSGMGPWRALPAQFSSIF